MRTPNADRGANNLSTRLALPGPAALPQRPCEDRNNQKNVEALSAGACSDHDERRQAGTTRGGGSRSVDEQCERAAAISAPNSNGFAWRPPMRLPP